MNETHEGEPQIKANNAVANDCDCLSAKQIFDSLGPGIVTGASDDDPSGIATYSLAGATYGFALLWMAPLLFPLVSSIEYMCAKIGMVTGTGLAGVLRKNYPRPLLILAVSLLVIANTINAGTDIGAIASCFNLLFPSVQPIWLVAPIALLIVITQFFGSYRVLSAIFKVFTVSLLSYFLCVFFVQVDLLTALQHTLIPEIHFNTAFMTMIVAILGTTISPYCFFWQASEEVEEEMKLGRRTIKQRLGATDNELRAAKIDVDFGMLVSVAVMYFIMLTTGATLHASGQFEIRTATDAAIALRPLAGDAAYLLFALGVIGTGFLAIPVLTDSAAYAVSEAFGVEPSLTEPPGKEKLFYFVIAASITIGTILNYVGINAIDALYFTAIVNGILAPPLLMIIMKIANDRKILGDKVNGRLANFLGWSTTWLMSACALFLIILVGRDLFGSLLGQRQQELSYLFDLFWW